MWESQIAQKSNSVMEKSLYLLEEKIFINKFQFLPLFFQNVFFEQMTLNYFK